MDSKGNNNIYKQNHDDFDSTTKKINGLKLA